MTDHAQTMLGPCIICGDTNYNLSLGGPTICPKCDCGHFDAATVESQSRIIASLREEIASLRAHPAIGTPDNREAMLEMGPQYNPVKEALRRMIAEFGDYHYHTCPADNDSGPCDCFAGHLLKDARRAIEETAIGTPDDLSRRSEAKVDAREAIRAILAEEADIDFQERRIDYGNAIERIAAIQPKQVAKPVAWANADFQKWITPHGKQADAAMMWREKTIAAEFPLYAAPPSDSLGSALPLCSCKASQRDGQHMMWCPVISGSARK